MARYPVLERDTCLPSQEFIGSLIRREAMNRFQKSGFATLVQSNESKHIRTGDAFKLHRCALMPLKFRIRSDLYLKRILSAAKMPDAQWDLQASVAHILVAFAGDREGKSGPLGAACDSEAVPQSLEIIQNGLGTLASQATPRPSTSPILCPASASKDTELLINP